MLIINRLFYCKCSIFRLLGKPLIIDFTQQSVENCLGLDLDIRFSSADLCECLKPENTNVQPRTMNDTNQMVFNRVSIKKKSYSDSEYIQI